MSTSFSFSRFGKLVRKQFYENLRFYTFSILALAGLLAIVFTLWVSIMNPRWEESETWNIFIVGLFISGTIFASLSFNMLGNKDKGIYWLGIPATHLEKLACTILYSTILFTLAYSLCFFGVKTIAIAVVKQMVQENAGMSYIPMTFPDEEFSEMAPLFVYSFFGIQAFYFLGSVYFSRYTFVVTTVVGALVFFAFAFLMNTLQLTVLKGFAFDLVSARKLSVDTSQSFPLYSVSSDVQNILKYVVQFVWAPLFWLVAWYRLKEKEM